MPDEPKGTASGTTVENPTGKETTVNGSIADVDFSDVPEDIREAVKMKVASKVKNFQSDYSKKTGDLATLRKKVEERETSLGEWIKMKEALDAKPELAKVLNQTWLDFESGKLGKSPKTVEKNLGLLDKLIKDTDNSDYKEDLRNLREIIKEETDTGGLKGEVKTLKDQIAALTSATRLSQVDRVDKGMEDLDTRFGKDIIDKNRDDIRSMMLKYPGQAAEKVFLQVADGSDIRTAYLNEAKAKEKAELIRKKRGLEPGGESFVGEIERPRTKEGRVDIPKFIKNIVQKHGLGKGL